MNIVKTILLAIVIGTTLPVYAGGFTSTEKGAICTQLGTMSVNIEKLRKQGFSKSKVISMLLAGPGDPATLKAINTIINGVYSRSLGSTETAIEISVLHQCYKNL